MLKVGLKGNQNEQYQVLGCTHATHRQHTHTQPRNPFGDLVAVDPLQKVFNFLGIL